MPGERTAVCLLSGAYASPGATKELGGDWGRNDAEVQRTLDHGARTCGVGTASSARRRVSVSCCAARLPGVGARWVRGWGGNTANYRISNVMLRMVVALRQMQSRAGQSLAADSAEISPAA